MVLISSFFQAMFDISTSGSDHKGQNRFKGAAAAAAASDAVSLTRRRHVERIKGKREGMNKEWKKEQASRCCTTDVCLCQSVNQLHNNQKRPNLFFFPLLGNEGRRSKPEPTEVGFTLCTLLYFLRAFFPTRVDFLLSQ